MSRARDPSARSHARVLLIAAGLGLVFGLADAVGCAVIDTWGTDRPFLPRFAADLLFPGFREMWMRGLVLALFIGFGAYTVLERRRSGNAIARLAYYDSLTGLANRTLLVDRTQHELAQANRHGEAVAVLFIDIDNFKFVNDTLGHEAGDMLLALVAGRLHECLRREDTIARIGGDEFVVVLRYLSDPRDAATTAQKIIDTMAAPFTIHRRQLNASASVGIAVFPQDGHDVSTLLKRADAAMYHAKSEGKNQYQFYAEDMNRRAHERLRLETDLHQALRRGEFVLHYQPQFERETLRPVGAEALIRWQRPEKGLALPREFLPAAEETGLIGVIGGWVLKTACLEAQAWPRELHVAVNVSLQEVMHEGFAEQVRQALATSGLAPARLEIEINDGQLTEQEVSWSRLRSLRELGVGIVLDGFGVSRCSLTCLARLPIDTLKIDKTFVKHLDRSQERAIVDSLLMLAKGLQLAAVGEGVETEAQLHYLRRQPCDRLQGFYLARPMPNEAFQVFLHTRADASA